LIDSLVLTIGHRLKTILGKHFPLYAPVLKRSSDGTDCDRVLVLGEGAVLEYDSPAALFVEPGGAFRQMCERSADWEELRDIVEANKG
jgi:hypothetical protein